MQDCNFSSANALEILQSCTKPLIYLLFWHIDGLVQNCNISSALALEILQSCTKPLICLSFRHDIVVCHLSLDIYQPSCVRRYPFPCRRPHQSAMVRLQVHRLQPQTNPHLPLQITAIWTPAPGLRGKETGLLIRSVGYLGLLLLTSFNFNPSMDK